MDTGKQGEYFWLTDSDLSIDVVLRVAPDILLGKHLLITAFDCGPLVISPEEQAAGWQQCGDFALSPRLVSCDVPYDNFDEWYVFDEGRVPNVLETFVKYSSFSLRPALDLRSGGLQKDDGANNQLVWLEKTQHQFWTQLQREEPRTFLSCGGLFNFATLDESIFRRLTALSERDSNATSRATK